jgi:CBS domain-containing protein
MQVLDIMTRDVACCNPDTNLREVARLMGYHNCGAIPVVDSQNTMRPVGIVTDRDITIRAVAENHNPLEMTAQNVMSNPVVTVTPDMSVEACCNIMEQNTVRRVPVIDMNGSICGIVAQADVALNASGQKTAEVVREVSQPA